MVEGPGCTLNGERLRRAGAIGQVVLLVMGSALQHADMQMLQGQHLVDVVTLGKELFLFFAPLPTAVGSNCASGPVPACFELKGCGDDRHINHVCVRLHFGMNGSLLVNSTHRFAGTKAPALEMRLSRDVVRLYQGTACLRCPRKTRQHIAKLSRWVSPSINGACTCPCTLPHALGTQCCQQLQPRIARPIRRLTLMTHSSGKTYAALSTQ